MKPADIEALARLIRKERKVDKRLLRALRSNPEKVPQLGVEHRALTHEIYELLPPAPDPMIDL
jgi:hypothetical protein